ncbi:ABC transporter permease [Nonomuraea sp. NPDC050328]|uniref:ABC transporter permease n=1 Tax=Nonomuraea sp. NPDC050328 TaxID=3364361 RepID=UPI003791018F
MITRTLREYRRGLLGWSTGIGLFMAMYISIFASLRDDPATLSAQAMAKYPGPLKDLMGGMQDIGTGTGYLQTVVYQLIVPLVFLVYAVGLANRALAQPEEARTLELVITLPIDRRRLLLERWAGTALTLVALAVATGAVVLLVAQSIDLGVPAGRILAAHTGVLLMTLCWATLALTVGSATGRAIYGTAAVGVWALAGYTATTVGRSIEAISWLKWVSPFHYYGEARPLYTGLPVSDYLVLVAVVAVLLLTAVLAFDRRDVGV